MACARWPSRFSRRALLQDSVLRTGVEEECDEEAFAEVRRRCQRSFDGNTLLSLTGGGGPLHDW